MADWGGLLHDIFTRNTRDAAERQITGQILRHPHDLCGHAVPRVGCLIKINAYPTLWELPSRIERLLYIIYKDPAVPNKIEVDIRTRFIPDTGKVYFLFPGNGYKYYRYMRDNNVVFIDVPGFPIPDNLQIGGLEDLVRRVIISDRTLDWHRKGRLEAENPDRSLRSAATGRATQRRILLAGIVDSFFSTLKKGDVIILPPQNLEEDVLFGEIADDGLECTVVDAPFHPGEKIPARRIKWLGRQRRMDVPRWMDRKIPSPNPLRQLEKSLHKYVYDEMYSRYYFDSTFVCKFGIQSSDFSALDNFLVQQLFLYSSALFEHSNEDNISNFSDKSISVVVSEITFSEDIPDQRIVINSPGHIVLYAKNIVPLLSAVLIAMAASSTPVSSGSVEILIKNSADSAPLSKTCEAEIASEVMEDIRVMGYARWQELCHIANEAKRRTGLDSGMNVSPSLSGGTDVKEAKK